ncbi:MFS transporter [Phycicoccus duodecadis]|uniref:CRP-like cAMP-binding protein n=1 Tax=Phycicoccus duodecadis TaxID=173053 RepID=A0A2N3YFT8_9MICO|nr:MFS transporter [Phycicoccus duodecadis]PKW25706.1 CRP-like cAMP-binding protein [Phycicoccus duodecadis]
MAVDAGEDAAASPVLRSALHDTWSSLRSVFGNPSLRRIELALAGSMIGDWAYATAVVVWAYGVGGARLVGIWGAVRLLLMAFASPLGSMLADRLPRKRVLITSDVLRALLAVLATLGLLTDAPAALVLVLATLLSLVGCVFRPAQMAWMPSLTRRPEELTAANGASSTIESLAFFLGPALGALLVSTTSVEVVFLLNAATFLLSAVLVGGIRPIAGPTPGDAGGAGADADAEQPRMLAQLAGGFTHIGHDRDLLMVAILVCTQTIVAGATIVFGVVFAVEILKLGPQGVGVIDSVFGVGAIVGGFSALARSTRNRVAGDLAVGTVLWSLPLLLVVAYPSPVTVFASAILLGFGNPLVDVNFATIVQRLTPDAVLGRVFGAYEGVLIGTMALGSAVMPFLISGLGLRWALAILAVVVGVPALAFLPRCRRLDASLRAPDGTALLRGLTIFSPLAPAKIEALARALTTETAPAGAAVVREGEVSDRFLVISSGRVEVTVAGEHIRFEGAGEFFGEIGLLRDVPRTATVTAVEDTVLYSLAREDFLDAVRGVDESLAAADDVVMRRLARA